MARSQGWDWFMAGLCLADLQREQVGDDVLGCLDQGLRWAIDGAADFYSNCPFGDDLAGDVGHTLRRLPHERVTSFVSPLIARLRQPVSGLASIGLTEGLLQAAFAAPLSEPLRDRERAALAALFYCDEVWKVINNQDAFLARNR